VSLAIDTEAPTAIVNTISEIAGTDFIININDKANGFIIKGTINGASDGDKVVVTFNSKDSSPVKALVTIDPSTLSVKVLTLGT
jgi:acylphosphatase